MFNNKVITDIALLFLNIRSVVRCCKSEIDRGVTIGLNRALLAMRIVSVGESVVCLEH